MDMRSQNPAGQDKCSPENHTNSLDTTQFNESVLAPILAARDAGKKEVSSKPSPSTAEESKEHTCLGKKSSMTRKRSAFEVMMAALEKPSKVHRASDKKNLPVDKKKNLPVDNKKNLPVYIDKNLSIDKKGKCSLVYYFHLGSPFRMESDSKHGSLPIRSRSETQATLVCIQDHESWKHLCTPRGKLVIIARKIHVVVVVVVVCFVVVVLQLMCLEEEIASHCEDGFLSQNSPVEIGMTAWP